MTRAELELLVRLKLVTPTRGTADGRITEYRLTWEARQLLKPQGAK